LTHIRYGANIHSWKRGKPVAHYEGHEAAIHLMLPFGKHLISVDRANVLNVFDIATGELFLSLDDLGVDYFTVTVSRSSVLVTHAYLPAAPEPTQETHACSPHPVLLPPSSAAPHQVLLTTPLCPLVHATARRIVRFPND
jgi:hypothetical protein